MDQHHTMDGTGGQHPQPPGPALRTWMNQAADPDLDDPYGDWPGPAWRTAPQDADEPVPHADHAGGVPAAGPVTSQTLTWPALPARPHRPRRRPAAMLAAVALLGAGIGTGIAALSSGQTIRFTPADNPAATSQYTPSAGPASQPSSPVSPPPGPASPPATASPSPVPASDPPAISRAAAGTVLAGFWVQNDQADKERSATLLSGIEAGTSYAIDAGAYQASRADDPADSRYTAITAASASTVYWIPRLASGSYPRWFAARVTYIEASQPQHDIVTGYLVFAQASPGAAWKDVLEPYLLQGTSTDPFIPADADGYATAAPADAAGLTVQPGDGLPPNPACGFHRTGLSRDLCRVRDGVRVDPGMAWRADDEGLAPHSCP
ncbi:MAG TPA: hypothetical protein VN969_36900 [Streptosporangiaceae bacterium]|nr:hypothetical protein [Streptosporangiaceae bacterium]